MMRIAWLIVTPILGAAQVDFQRDIHPLLAAKCFACHGGDKRAGGLSLRDYESVLQGGRSGPVIMPGASAESLLIRRVTGELKPAMPPAGPGLTERQIAVLRTWIDEGARPSPKDPPARKPWIAPLALQKPALPPIQDDRWRQDVDRVVFAYFQERGWTPPAAVSDALFARRVFLDLWGVTPPPARLRAFVEDTRADKRPRLVDELLADARNYAEHWLSFWNDLLRNDDFIFYAGEHKSISPWLSRALETNMPYNVMVSKLLNPVEKDDPDGFLIGINWRGDVSASQTQWMQAAQNSAQIFLGINLKCAACHDSFVSRWKLKQSYALAAYFSPQPQLELVRCDIKTGEFTGPGFLFPELDQPLPSDTLADRRAMAARLFTDPRNGRMPRTIVNRIWQRLMGRGIVEPVDELDNEPWSPLLLDWLASDFVAHNYDLKYLIRTIVLSQAYQLPAVERDRKSRQFVFRGPEIRRMSAEQFADTLSYITGEWRTLLRGDAEKAVAAREYRLPANSLTRALGRPIRDQVITERDSEATTLQALELVNGQALMTLLRRGAQRLLGELPPPVAPLWDSRRIAGSSTAAKTTMAQFKIDISQARRLHLIVTDVGSYAPELTKTAWVDVYLIGPKGKTPLTALKPLKQVNVRQEKGEFLLKGQKYLTGLRTGADSELVYDLAGRGFTHLEGQAGLEDSSLTSEINPAVRFFIYDREPNREQMTLVSEEVPLPRVTAPREPQALVEWLWEFALSRPPTTEERRAALDALTSSGERTAALADLLWSLAMLPEFQLIR